MMDRNNHSGRRIGNYYLLAELGSGSYGVIYQGKHIVFGDNASIVAIKLLHANINSPQKYNRFIQEAQLLQKLEHPHILPIVDAGMEADVWFLVTKYAPGGSLRDLLKKQPRQPLLVGEALKILSQVGQALEYAHRKEIVHRDVKPENILFNAQGEALLADFGMATILAAAKTQKLDLGGTPAYMAPEQFSGMVSMKSDQYALGCLAYELVTGNRPFSASDPVSMGLKHGTEPPTAPRQLNPSLPKHIEEAILRAMAKERADRYASVADFITALCISSSEGDKQSTSSSQNPPHSDIPTSVVSHETERQLLEDALTAFKKARELDPNKAAYHYEEGKTLYYLRRYEEAVAALEQAIELDSRKADRIALLAFEQAIKLDPKKAVYHYDKGRAFYNLKQFEEAIAAFEQAITLDPKKAVYHYDKGRAFYDFKHNREASVAFEQAIKLDPKKAVYHYDKGRAFYNLKQFEEAIAAFEQAIKLDPNKAVYHYDKGRAFYDFKQYEKAIAAFEQAIKLGPKKAIYHYDKGRAFYNLKQFEEAIAAFEQAITLDPKKAVYHYDKGRAFYGLEHYREASAAFEQAITLDPNKAVYHYDKGRAFYRLTGHEEDR